MKRKYLYFTLLLAIVLNTRQLVAQISLTATGGTTSLSYTTLKDAFDAINAGTHTGIIGISVTASTTESASAVLNASGSGAASYTRIDIQPTAGSPVSISGSIAGPLIDLNGADNVFINGLNLGGNALTLNNVSTSNISNACTIRYINDAVGDTVTNCSILGSTTSSTLGTIIFSTGTTTGNDNNVISNCLIDASGSNSPTNAIFSSGTATAGIENSNVTITNNQIANYFNAGLSTSGITLSAGSINWTISNNKLYQSASRTYTTGTTHRGISAATGYGHNISGNTIGYNSSSATGMTVMTAAVAITYVAINVTVSNTQTTSIQNNRINAFNFTTTATTSVTAGVFCGVNIAAGAANVNVIGNTFGATSGTDSIVVTAGSIGLLVGINSSSTGIVAIQNNTFGAFTNANALLGAYMSSITTPGAHSSLTITGNTIGNSTANNMRAGTLGTTTGVTQMSGVNASGISTGTTTINNNTIQNLSSLGSGGGWARGIQTAASTLGTSTYIIKFNTITNITSNGVLITIASGVAALNGIHIGVGVNDTISNNTINNLFLINTASTNICALGIGIASAKNAQIFNNTINNIQNAGTSVSATLPAVAAGIAIRAGTTSIKIYNNMISLGTGQTTNTAFIGIWAQHGSTPDPIDSVLFNTINITGTLSGTPTLEQPSFGYYRGDFSVTARTAATVLYNNIFTNDRSGTTGKHYAIANNYGATTPTATGWGANASNYNVLNAAAANVGWWTTDRTIAAWRATSLSDNNSPSGVTVNYVNSASDLHLNMGTAVTLIESGATPIGTITTDIDGQVRPGPAGSVNGGGSLPDIGADEADMVPIGMVLDSSNTDQVTGNVPLGARNQAVIRIRMHTSNSALPIVLQSLKLSLSTTSVSDIDTVRVFFTGSNPTLSTSVQYGTFLVSPSSTFNVTGSQTLSAGVNYFWLTYNVRSTALVNNTIDAILDSVRLSGVNYAPINGDPLGNRIIKAPLSGDYNVGIGNPYPTLTSIVSDLNNLGVSAPVRFILTDPSYTAASGEIFPITFNAHNNSSATNTVTILPAASNTTSINGSNATAIFDFNGVANITVSGMQNGNGGVKNLTIENTDTAGVAVRFINDANNIRLSNDSIKGVNTAAAGGVIFFGTGIVNGNDNIVIDSCNIGDGLTGTPASAFYALGSTTNTNINNSNVTISNCNIYNFFNATTESNAFKISGGNTDWIMSGNSIYQTATRTATAAIQHYVWNCNNTSANNHKILNNYIGGSAPLCGGTAWTATSTVGYRITGAYLNVGAITPSSFSGNTFANINLTSATTAYGTIPGVFGATWLVGGLTNVTNNTFGSMSSLNSIVINSGISNNMVVMIGATGTTAGTINIKNNNMGGITVAGSSASVSSNLFGINITTSGNTVTYNIDSNTIGNGLADNMITSSASTSTTGQQINGVFSSAASNLNVRYNNIQNFRNNAVGTSVTPANWVHAIDLGGNGIDSIIGNTISNHTINSAFQTNNSGSAALIGIRAVSATAGNFISGNNIYGLTQTNTTAASVSVIGIITNSMLATSLVQKNYVHGLNILCSGTAASVFGINHQGGNARYVNNVVQLGVDSAGISVSTTPLMCGLYKFAGTFTALHNSIYVGGTNIGVGLANTFAFQITTAGVDSLINNIFVNERSNATTGGTHYTIAVPTTLNLASNRNVYWYNGTGGALGLFNTTTANAFNNWTGLCGVDNNSGFGNPQFINPTGSNTSLDMHINATLPSPVEGNGILLSSVVDDMDGQTRSGLTPIDIGADAGNFITSDVFAPQMLFTPLTNYGATTDRTFSVTMIDRSNVSASAFPPTVYYKKFAASPTYVNAQGTRVSGTVGNGVWNFTLSAGAVGGFALNDSIYYYVVAQDSSSNNNLGSLPGGVIASNTGSIATDPPTVYSFRIVPALGGLITVGTGGTYSNLTGTGGAFDAINNSSITGNTTLSIISNIEEPGTIFLNQLNETGTGNYVLTIAPDGTTERVLSGSVATTNGIITLNGADRVKIDGRFNGAGRYLRLRNRNAAGSTIRLLNDARRDSILYTFIEGTTTSVGAVYFSAPLTGGFGNDSNVVMYNIIRDTLNNPATGAIPNTGLYSDGSFNSENIVAFNEFVNYTFQGINITAANNDNWTISNNSFYQQAAGANKAGTLTSGPTQAIFINSITSGGYTISNNNIGGSAADRSGAAYAPAFSTLGVTARAIDLNVNSTVATNVTNNNISNWNTVVGANASGSVFIGIGVSAGLVNITGNTIGGGAAAYDTIQQNSYSVTNTGAIVLVGGNVTVSNNTIGNITDLGATLSSSNRTIGITAIGSLAGSNFNIINNTIRDIKSLNQPAAATATTYNAMSPAGIVVTALATVPVNIEGNNIYNLMNTFTGGANTAAGLNIRGGTCTVHRNRIYNINGVGTGTGTSSNYVYGIMTTTIGHTFRNNQVSLATTSPNEAQLFGIMDASASVGANNYYNNTVVLSGAANGANNTYAFVMGTVSTKNILNNIFYNGRNGGTGNHFAMGAQGVGGISPSTSNYNLLITTNGNAVAEMPAANPLNIAALNSLYPSGTNGNWIDVTSSVPVASLFTNTSIGDLSIVTTNNTAWYANGKGLPITSVTNDFNGTARSVSIPTGSVDLGSVEFNTSIIPPSAIESVSPSLNGTTTYTFANRAIASVTWGASGTVPSSLDVKYYTGVNAPSLLPSRTQYNSYYTVAPTGGSGYTYTVAFAYDTAMFGSVSSASASRLARYVSSWNLISGSSANAGLLSSTTALAASTLPATFTGTDQVNPLPVNLISIDATKEGNSAVLKWTTASELNNKGFEIERSVDGDKFEWIGFINGSGNSNKAIDYRYMDENIFMYTRSNTLYYRLHQVDRDGNATYSDIVSVTAEKDDNHQSVYPNPFNDNYTVSFNTSVMEPIIISMLDIHGRVHYTQKINSVKGFNEIHIADVEYLNSGLYFIKISMSDSVKVIKVSKH